MALINYNKILSLQLTAYGGSFMKLIINCFVAISILSAKVNNSSYNINTFL